ncbi:alpha/beta fold hydrolase [Micromonospora sp. 067-2]|uniref:alpha/beta fold hydrolase n=1 Tax=Micromonospora sp. 067-2 TaxID=2789270 RepID=UPI00397CDE75
MRLDNLGQVADLRLDPARTVHYLRAGSGPALVLLHTIRTQLEYFADIIPILANNHTVYAVDLLGHGHSSKPAGIQYDEPYLRRGVIDTMRELGLTDVTLVGESIGGVLALTVASQMPEAVSRVVTSNPYDYDTRFADGVRRGRLFANLILGGVALPVIGPILGAGETRFVTGTIMQGGLGGTRNVPDPLLDTFAATRKEPGYPYVERNVYQNWRSWGAARELYPAVRAPRTLIYGERDWSRPAERARTAQALGEKPVVVPDAGHFTCLEQPRRIADIIG